MGLCIILDQYGDIDINIYENKVINMLKLLRDKYILNWFSASNIFRDDSKYIKDLTIFCFRDYLRDCCLKWHGIDHIVMIVR